MPLCLQYAVRVRQTRFPKPYWMAYTDPSLDVDVSRHVEAEGLLEPGLSMVW